MSFSKQSSRLFGFVSKCKFPKFIQKIINEKYVNYFKIDMSEFKNSYEYDSLNALFTRSLEIPRKLDEGFISPCDGKILECGHTFLAKEEHFAFSIKGCTYSVEELLRDNFEKEELKNGLDYVNIYLSPKDYHRYHSPCNMQILSASYISGMLYSVNEKSLKHVGNLYVKNERVSLKCQTQKGIFWLVFIGAQNVGKMRFNFDASIQTNAKISHNFTRKYTDLMISKAQELGNFELGSTIVLISQKGLFDYKLKIEQNVKFGEKIAD
ncbi:phosphatidylserine decarboxylase [Campylobacter hepaticus]|uniref:phosphatidylserine decarboxylase n=1 Tax=Campylobacter hepaticus TaxID=1813019 RepID=A0A6A7JR84_9BACT|nr:phosphatidylserine decarboxylase [Campylobacter hepaticus]AXP08609.1 phosphatidylserine decarboxylase [Campylobacter hepaticus]MCZ0772451.1 phosphatidylserine decarboxylase [Campylobacter hepaticus]MCZ0773919.1 phosphatidylserine decarboxylase [Campylobacter hepaticus]MCZ0775170.1 phosphatidylserine decarboxylase [Campylobacter hepaticus]MPV53841.1 phosphatidylserine decarboxylase [Campylobacter hepaticus]